MTDYPYPNTATEAETLASLPSESHKYSDALAEACDHHADYAEDTLSESDDYVSHFALFTFGEAPNGCAAIIHTDDQGFVNTYEYGLVDEVRAAWSTLQEALHDDTEIDA